MSDVAERVKKIVVEHLGVEADKVTDNASFIDDLGADRLDTVELGMAFEEEFGCEIPDDAAEQIQTVGDAVKFLEQHASALSLDLPRFRAALDAGTHRARIRQRGKKGRSVETQTRELARAAMAIAGAVLVRRVARFAKLHPVAPTK